MEKKQLTQKEFYGISPVLQPHTTPAAIKRLQRRARLIAQELARFKDPKVMELGCRTGGFSKFVLEGLPLLRLACCDISPKAVQIASNRYGDYKNACFELVDASSMHYDTGTFDAIIGNSVLHHLPIETSLRECFRVLKPGGIIWFSEPNMMNPEVFIEVKVCFIKRILKMAEDETAFFRWSLINKLRKIGFQDVSVQPFEFLHPIAPRLLINFFDRVGRFVERVPLLRELSGSLLIYACKPDVLRKK